MSRLIQVTMIAAVCAVGALVYDDFNNLNRQADESPPSETWSRCDVTPEVVNNDFVCLDVDYDNLYSNIST